MKNPKVVTVYVDGAGADPNGISGCAWLRDDGRKHVEWGRNWTNNEAEYRAILLALLELPSATHAEIVGDSALVIRQLCGNYATRAPRLRDLCAEIQRVIHDRRLIVTWRWIRRAENKADKLLRHRPAEIPEQRPASSVRLHRRKRRSAPVTPALCA